MAIETANLGLVTHAVLFARDGENATSPPGARGAILAREGGRVTYRAPRGGGAVEVDLAETRAYCINWDNDGLVEGLVHAVGTITLPAWLTIDEYLCDSTTWTFGWAQGIDRQWPGAWQRGLARLSPVEQRVGAALLRARAFRSGFRASALAQLVAWLESPVEGRRFASPWSPRQLDCLGAGRERREAERVSSGLYYALRYNLPAWEAIEASPSLAPVAA